MNNKRIFMLSLSAGLGLLIQLLYGFFGGLIGLAGVMSVLAWFKLGPFQKRAVPTELGTVDTPSMNKKIFLLSIGLGLLIGVLSAGKRTSWDAQVRFWLYQMTSLFIAGLVPALIEPRRWWSWPVGVYLGQVLSILGIGFLGTYSGANMALVGVVLMAGYMLPTVIGAGLGAAIRGTHYL